MPHSHINLLYHVVFGTKERLPLISEEIRPRLYDYMGSVIADRKGVLLCANGIDDHVHLLAKTHQSTAIAELVRDVKANSSRWVRQTFRDGQQFGWQEGYGAFSVSESDVARVRLYIANQRAHHRQFTFQEEFIALLEEHGIEYDERDIGL
jgi:putative transposase